MTLPPSIPHNYTPLTPVSFLLRAALIAPDSPAIVHPERGVKLTYSQWAARTLSLTFGILGTQGWRTGERVAVIAPNCPMILELHTAILAAGGIITPINIRNTPAEIAYILKHSGSRLIFCDSEYQHLLRSNESSSPSAQIIISNDSGGRDDSDPYEHFLDAGHRIWAEAEQAGEKSSMGQLKRGWELIDHPANENAPAALCYTSGTTGRPKGVLTTHRGAYLAAISNAFEAGLGAESVYLWVLPAFHACGWTFPWAVNAAFAAHYILRKVDNDQIWSALLQGGTTHYAGAPTVQIGIVNHGRAERLPRTIRVAVAASAPTSALLSQMEKLNLLPVHVYGLTESYGPVSRRYPHRSWADLSTDDRARLMARQGHGFLTADEVRVCRVPPEDADPQSVALEDVRRDGKEMGEIVMRGNIVMQEYYNDAEATRKTFRDGWFCTGDLAVRHPGGEIQIADRKKDLYISGGENVSSLMVETELSSHPAVLECAVVARKDPKWQEVGHAFVVLRPDHRASEKELQEHCRKHMSKFAVPKFVDLVAELPKNATGKLQKNVLRERVAKLAESAADRQAKSKL
ncbi:acetyl-CoA synthetase-like protein [Ceraceosorus guamensis]|uniref:Acetyl-CoA synthetase-like protein n=1 Tax=Ceraceosorus guamensis TaxID=1522189 RepID=A0A316W2S5_9BASI|nr:acetyl-CoA synthetase-like protein [Ceraceosorus guamensis]PWN41955.1 acetyl-CoA synthetase-like protein [Ceraceosorus guamensis]